ncbi:MAG: cytochrome c maturation protein CcmE [Chloroflexi bacterium]|nr:cytochrome c maturation protein CcmE [Chloroflexota bacterium]
MQRGNFIIAALLVLAAVIYLIVSSTGNTARYFLTIDELLAMGDDAIGRRITVSGAVLGQTILVDPDAPRVTFTIVHVPGDPQTVQRLGGLASVLHQATMDPERARLQVVYDADPPDLLRDEAQAIVRGSLREDGQFHADEVLLKCPSRYAEDIPDQIE